MAKEVLAGAWGNGDERKNRLTAAELRKQGNQGSSSNACTGKKDVTAVAKEVIAGKWGNGDDRKKKLQAAGYDYAAVQAEVNRLAKAEVLQRKA